jgi:hypothetical protein
LIFIVRGCPTGHEDSLGVANLFGNEIPLATELSFYGKMNPKFTKET